MALITDELIAELTSTPVRRHRITEALGIQKGVATILRRASLRLTPPHVVERRRKGKQFEVEYLLRPAGRLMPGQIIEVEAFSAELEVTPSADR